MSGKRSRLLFSFFALANFQAFSRNDFCCSRPTVRGHFANFREERTARFKALHTIYERKATIQKMKIRFAEKRLLNSDIMFTNLMTFVSFHSYLLLIHS